MSGSVHAAQRNETVPLAVSTLMYGTIWRFILLLLLLLLLLYAMKRYIDSLFLLLLLLLLFTHVT